MRETGRFEHPHLAEVVPNCLVTFYDMHSESSGIFYCPIPAGSWEGDVGSSTAFYGAETEVASQETKGGASLSYDVVYVGGELQFIRKSDV